MNYAYSNFGLPAAPEPVADGMNRFSHRSSIPCPECAAEGKEVLMRYDPWAKEWMCPECHCDAWDNEPYSDLSDVIDALAGHLIERSK